MARPVCIRKPSTPRRSGRALGCKLRMSARSFVPFILAFGANVVWQGLLLIIDPIPRGRADIYGEAAAMWVLPSIGNLVFLYRKRVFARWQRVGRAVALCAVSAAATHFALIVALALDVIVPLTLHRVPKPNHPAAGKAGITRLLAIENH